MVYRAGALEIDLGGIRDGDHAGIGVDGESRRGRIAGQRVGHRAGPLTSVEAAVMPTAAAAAPSSTVLAAASLSTGVDGATSVTAMVKVCGSAGRRRWPATVMV